MQPPKKRFRNLVLHPKKHRIKIKLFLGCIISKIIPGSILVSFFTFFKVIFSQVFHILISKMQYAFGDRT